MAAFTSKASGNWSSAGQTTWNEVGVPVAGDTVTIAANHVVTVDDTSRACAAITLNGTLSASRTANCTLSFSGAITVRSTGHLDWGTNASPIPAAYTATLIPANGIGITQDATSYGGKITFHGDTGRNPWTTIVTPSLSAPVVADATGWKVGDELLFVPASATNNNADHIEIVTLGAGYTPGSTTLAVTLAQTHIAGGRVCNLTRNCVVSAAGTDNGGPITLRIDGAVNAALSTYFKFAQFKNINNNATTGTITIANGQVNINSLARYSGASRVIDDVDSCVFYRTRGATFVAWSLGANRQFFNVNDSVFVDTSGSTTNLVASAKNNHFIDCTFATAGSWLGVFNNSPVDVLATRCWVSGSASSNGRIFPAGAGQDGIRLTDCIFSGRFVSGVSNSGAGLIRDSGSDWGSTYGLYMANRLFDSTANPGGVTDWESTDSKFNTYTDVFNVTGWTLGSSISRASLFNKNDNTAVQEYYTPQGRFSRETTTVKNSTSSLKAETTTTDNIAQTYTFQIAAKTGESLKMIGYLRKNASYGSSTRPTVTASFAGTQLDTHTMTDVTDTWEVFELDFSQTSGTDGLIDIAFTIQSSSSSAVAYLSGVTTSPFVTRARHYGYLVNESSATQVVDPVISAAFATADAYTGFSISWGASSTLTVTGNNTFQKAVDYTAAKMIANVGSALPITWAGVAGSPVVFAQGNVTINDGFVLNGSGSLSMGSHTLSTEFVSGTNYTYTGGAWSQLTTVPTFSGGTLNLGAAGTYTFTMSSAIISMTPTTPGTYSMGGGSFSGTIDLRNTTANAITVELPSGVTYTTANNTGGTITVSTPQLYQSVTVSNITTGSRVQIYDTTSNTELSNAIAGGTSVTWTDANAASADRAIRVRITYVSGATAKEMIEANIGTCGQTAETAAVSYLANQTADTTYNTNAIDGSTVTNITIDDSTNLVKIAIPGGAVTWPQIYAYQVYWLNTSTGIQDDFAFIEAPDTANYLLTGFQIKNTSSPSVPLVISSGYGRDATTGASVDLVDTTGGTLIFAPDHVVAYSSGSGLTAGQDAALTAIKSKTDSLTFTVGNQVDANVRSMNSATVNGNGTSGDKWRG